MDQTKVNTSLDLSSHNLNNSSSKQKFSFPKADRFRYSNQSIKFIENVVVILTIKFQSANLKEQLLLAMERGI